MTSAVITVDRDFTVGEVPRRLFGSFVEHMGRCVYTGIFEPGHPSADENGFRTDVLELVRELGPTVVRYPGGNFVSGYQWEDGVGPQQDRPVRLDRAWHTIETNQFGLSEFAAWSKKAGTEIMLAVNLGTRGLQEACDLLEYANHPSGTYLSDKRIAHGDKEPYDIRLWCLGNEMDGPWQTGHKTAHEYGRLAAETARAMRSIDPRLELVACGSSNSKMPTFGSWERTVLEHTYDQVDYISLHAYYEETEGDAGSFLASALDTDHFIESVVATADAVRAKGRHSKRINLSFDEWNVWYNTAHHASEPSRVDREGWIDAPRLIEDEYSVTDAVVVGTLLNSLLRHGDRVTVAAQAQLVNVIAPIRSEAGGPAWRQTIFHPFARMAALARGRILRLAVTSEEYPTARFGDVPVVDASGTWDDESGLLTLFLANRSLDAPADVETALRGLDAGRVVRAEVLTTGEGQDRHTVNTRQAPDRVAMTTLTDVQVGDGTLRVRLPALSWAVIQLEVTSA